MGSPIHNLDQVCLNPDLNQHTNTAIPGFMGEVVKERARAERKKTVKWSEERAVQWSEDMTYVAKLCWDSVYKTLER